MNAQRVLVALTVVNMVLLTFSLMQLRPAVAQDAAPVLRGTALEIVDQRGRVRASIKLQAADPTITRPGGTPYPETVMLRLIDAQGRPEVKIGASVEGGSLSLIGETDIVHALLLADGANASLKLVRQDGRQQFVKP